MMYECVISNYKKNIHKLIHLNYMKNLVKSNKTRDKMIILHHGIWWCFVASCKLGRMAVSRPEAKTAEFLIFRLTKTRNFCEFLWSNLQQELGDKTSTHRCTYISNAVHSSPLCWQLLSVVVGGADFTTMTSACHRPTWARKQHRKVITTYL